MNQEKFWVLLSKKLSGEASSPELKELENLILDHPEWQYAIQNLEDLWKHQPQKDTLQEEDAYMLHLHRMAELNIPFDDRLVHEPALVLPARRIKWYWAAAATIVIIAGYFILSKKNGSNEENGSVATSQKNEISTQPGSRSRIQLPDGTIVMLNGGSKLTYNKDFGKILREVTLAGEGFFDVKKMKETPFIIHTSSINIKVLGTVFNVKAYPEDNQTETSLIHGSIEVTMRNRPDNKVILSPNEKLIVENESFIKKEEKEDNKQSPPAISINKLKYSPVDSTIAETQWVNNKLVFNDETFAELALRMERWYNVDIEIRDPKLSQKRITGNFEKETIDQAIEALKEMIPFHHEQKGNKIIFHR